jgi:hypothetical protein
MFAGLSIAPRGGAKGIFGWSDDFLGFSGLTLGAVGAGLGLMVGLFLALKRGWADPRNTEANDPPVAPLPPEGPGPRDAKRSWLRARRRRDAPKRFGKRGR